jgi:hypothetical protein
MLRERSFYEFLKLNAVPALGVAVYTYLAYQFPSLKLPLWGSLVVLVALLALQYVNRRSHRRQGLSSELRTIIGLFPNVTDDFRKLCQTFEVNPSDNIKPMLENYHWLIMQMILLLQVIVLWSPDFMIDRRAVDFLRVLSAYKRLVVLTFVGRANAAKQVTKGTKIRFARFKSGYNKLVDDTNRLAGLIDSEMRPKEPTHKELTGGAVKIVEELEAVET